GQLGRAAFSPDGTLVVTTSGDSTMRVWDAGTGKQLLSVGGPFFAGSLVFSPSGSSIAVEDILSVRLVETATGQTLFTLRHPTGMTDLSVSFSPDGRRVLTASASADARGGAEAERVWVWDT